MLRDEDGNRELRVVPGMIQAAEAVAVAIAMSEPRMRPKQKDYVC